MTTANPFADLVPSRPTPSQYAGNLQDYMTAVQAWRAAHPPVTTPTPAPTPSPAPAPTPTPAPPTSATGTGSGQTTGTTNALSPSAALNNFANSAGMQFQLKQGEDAIQNNYAAHGALQSGAAMKALQSYGQQTALQNYFMPYMQLLGGQQAVGAQAGSAVTGVGSSFGDTVANINSNLGANSANINGQMAGYIGNGADAASNAALAKGYNNGQMWSTIGSALGQQFGSSFAPTPHY